MLKYSIEQLVKGWIDRGNRERGCIYIYIYRMIHIPRGGSKFPLMFGLSKQSLTARERFNATNRAPQRATSTNLTPMVCTSLYPRSYRITAPGKMIRFGVMRIGKVNELLWCLWGWQHS